MRTLVVFDLDGTLTDTSAVDGRCFLEALRAFGIEEVDDDWAFYPDCTDSGILSDLFERVRGRRPTPTEWSRFVEVFAGALERAHADDPGLYAAVPGAPALLERLPSEGLAAAIATGACEVSARLKLDRAGIDARGLPFASSDDARSREDIVRIAIRRSNESRAGSFGRVVLVGDAVWDARTAARLGLPLLGVARGDRARALLEGGASAVVPDFLDQRRVLELLSTISAVRGGP